MPVIAESVAVCASRPSQSWYPVGIFATVPDQATIVPTGSPPLPLEPPEPPPEFNPE